MESPDSGNEKSSFISELIDKITSIFSGGDDPERERKKRLKNIGKILKNSNARLFNVKSMEALPNLAKFFYEVYKVVAQAQSLLENADSSGVLRTIVIESVLKPDQITIKEALEENEIRNRSNETDLKKLADEVRDELVTYFAIFDAETVRSINLNYNLLLILFQLINFDYYFLLKKFDSNLPERNFVYHPRFETINGEYVSDDIKDFLEVLAVFEKAADWDSVFNILKEFRGIDVIARDQWAKISSLLQDLKRSGLLLNIIRFMDKNPDFKVIAQIPNERIVEPYLTKIKTSAEMVLQKILQERRGRRVEDLCKQVFGTTAVSRLKFYTEKTNVAFSRRMLGGFLHIEALNYLKAFLLDYYKRDIREFVDIMLIRGKWTTNLLSQQLSEAFHQLMQLSDELNKLDDSVGEEGEIGSRFKNMLLKADKDSTQLKLIRQLLKDVNDKAQYIINESAGNLISLGKSLKILLEDYKKNPHELIINWKDIENASSAPIQEQIATIYKKIYYFVQLMQMYVKSTTPGA